MSRKRSNEYDAPTIGASGETEDTPSSNGDAPRVKKSPTFARYIMFGRSKATGALVQLHDAANRRRLVKWYGLVRPMVLDSYTDLSILRAKPVTLAECGIE